uniref:Uncharacterized protein n=1 Tax=Sus scrofa TaxID=9823 RepID=A0A8D1QAT0_PIG
MIKKEISVCQQTQALLYKNLLKKWRMKKESLLEWTVALLLVLSLCTFREIFKANHFPEQPPRVLGHVDEFNDSDPEVVAYTPVTHVTQRIMNKMAMASFMTGVLFGDRGLMIIVFPKNDSEMVGIVFTDTFSYRLKFPWGHRTPDIGEHFEYSGFVAFPTAMNAAVIEIFCLVDISDWNKYEEPPFISRQETINEWFIFICVVCFSPFVHVASLNMTKERKKCKKLMTLMGLRESAFWLSWALMDAVITGFMVIVALFILYGLSVVSLQNICLSTCSRSQIYEQIKVFPQGVPVVAQRKRICLETLRLPVRSLALLSGLRIRRCCGCGVGRQLQLRFHA